MRLSLYFLSIFLDLQHPWWKPFRIMYDISCLGVQLMRPQTSSSTLSLSGTSRRRCSPDCHGYTSGLGADVHASALSVSNCSNHSGQGPDELAIVTVGLLGAFERLEATSPCREGIVLIPGLALSASHASTRKLQDTMVMQRKAVGY